MQSIITRYGKPQQLEFYVLERRWRDEPSGFTDEGFERRKALEYLLEHYVVIRRRQ